MTTLKKLFTRILIICLSLTGTLNAQTLLTLQPLAEDAKDAEIWNLEPSENYGDWPEVKANAWTWSGEDGYQRALFEFDLSEIPAGATIVSAELSLYGVDGSSTQYHSGENKSWLKRITQSWEENTVTWSTQPSTTDVDQVMLETSSSALEDYLDIDVKNLINDMIADPTHSFGFMLELQSESIYRRMTFLSSDQDISSKNPKLVIEYTTSEEPVDTTIECVTLKPGSKDGFDAEIWSLEPTMNYGEWPEVKTNAWTWDGTPGYQRSLIKFDLSSVPDGAIIESAALSLYALDEPSTQYHSGVNETFIQRITSEWDENIVTWSTQPTTTTTNEVTLATSTSEYENYLDVDVKALIEDMLADPSHSFGFMFRLENEDIYRRMSFASSDNETVSKHPELEICYKLSTAISEIEKSNGISVYPNPVSDNLTINLPVNVDDQSINVNIYNMNGQTVFTGVYSASKTLELNLSQLFAQNYLISITIGDQIFTKMVSKY